MSIRLNAGDVTRSDLFLIDPENIIVDYSQNGRKYEVSDADVMDLVAGFKSEGQHTPVQVRRVAGKKVQLVFGYRRHHAATVYNQLNPDNKMQLKCIVANVNEEDALKRNASENIDRKQCTPVDVAHTQQIFRERHGWTDTKIAEFYHCTPAYVGFLSKLMRLDSETQLKVHEGVLSAKAAVDLSDLPENEQKEVMATPVEPGETLSNTVTKRVREKKIEAGGRQARNMKEVKAFLESLTGPAEDAKIKSLALTMLKFCQGYYSDKDMENRLREIFGLSKAA